MRKLNQHRGTPSSPSRLQTQQGVGKHPPSGRRSLRVAVVCACVNPCWLSTPGAPEPKRAPKAAFKVELLHIALVKARGFGARTSFQAFPGVCTYFWLPLREGKSLFATPEETSPPLLSTGESSAPGSYRRTLC